jgi:hypothetical protein
LSVDAVHDIVSDVLPGVETAKFVGAVGFVVSAAHAAVAAVRVACADTLPAASNACTASVWLVPQARPVKVNDVVVVVPALTPSRKTVYPVTPTLSVDAVQENGIVVVVAAPTASPEGAVGADVSGQAAVDAVSVARVETLPAASAACTPTVWLVPQLRPVNVKLVVVTVPAFVPSRKSV